MLGMRIGMHGNGLNGSGKEWDSDNTFPSISR